MTELRSEPRDFAAVLRNALARRGPMPVATYMAQSNAWYYENLDGLAQDFATAPELTQAFGEMVGLWAADLWDRAGRPPSDLVEFGPGRGVMMADMARAAAKAGWTPSVHLVETSAKLRLEQASRIADATWHVAADTLPGDAPLIVVANEFLDALPVRQFVATKDGWRQRHVTHRGGTLAFVDLPAQGGPAGADRAQSGTVWEERDAALGGLHRVFGLIAANGGAAMIVDYGHLGPAPGDTLQAMRRGERVDPLAYPGDADLTAHVDFAAAIAAARRAGCVTHGPVPQGRFLTDLGLHQRTAALARANPARAARLQAAALRLTQPQHMGALFKVLGVTAPGWPRPAAL